MKQIIGRRKQQPSSTRTRLLLLNDQWMPNQSLKVETMNLDRLWDGSGTNNALAHDAAAAADDDDDDDQFHSLTYLSQEIRRNMEPSCR